MSGEVAKTEQSNVTPIAAQHNNAPMNLIEQAIAKDADVVKLEKLMDLQERWETKESRKSFYFSLSSFQSQIPVITKRGQASFAHNSGTGMTEYSYAKLEDITEAVKPFLVKNGLSYRYEQKVDQQTITVICIVTHLDGHEERTEMSAFPDQSGKKNPIQQLASTVSYLRRYTLTGALGVTVSDEDNDAGNFQGGVEEQVVCYPDDKFQTSFPAWEKKILEGKKTADSLLAYLTKKGVVLSQVQYDKLKQVENSK